MAGTLTISTLSDGTNSTSATNCIQGSAKAWVNFNGTNSSIRASYNVSSVTTNSTGNYTVTFTNALADTSYAANVTADSNQPGIDACSAGVRPSSMSTTSFGVGTHNANNTAVNYNNVMCSVFR